MRVALILGVLVSLVGGTPLGVAATGDAPICSALLYEDAELMNALPERLRPIFESTRVRDLVIRREVAWAKFHSKLDWGLKNPGKKFVAQIDDLKATMVFKKNLLGQDQLWIDGLTVIKKNGVESAPTAFQFLDFMAAEVGWIAKARIEEKITGVAIIGKDPRSLRAAELMESLGFKPGAANRRCYIFSLVGGFAGFGAGKVFFVTADADVENGSIYEEQRKYFRDVAFGSLAGAGGAAALACFNKTGRNYSIEFRPSELPGNPDTLPPGDVPPIDFPSSINPFGV